MTRVNYLPSIPEYPPPTSSLSQWSFGIAMFAAFVIPFVLLATSARYRGFVERTSLKIGLNKFQIEPSDAPASGKLTNSGKLEK